MLVHIALEPTEQHGGDADQHQCPDPEAEIERLIDGWQTHERRAMTVGDELGRGDGARYLSEHLGGFAFGSSCSARAWFAVSKQWKPTDITKVVKTRPR